MKVISIVAASLTLTTTTAFANQMINYRCRGAEKYILTEETDNSLRVVSLTLDIPGQSEPLQLVVKDFGTDEIHWEATDGDVTYVAFLADLGAGGHWDLSVGGQEPMICKMNSGPAF